MDNKTYAKLLKAMLDYLGEMDKDQFPTIRKYLKNNEVVAVKWLNENMKTERQYNFSQYMSWTEQSLDEIDSYS
ncbi:MAG: hypothetical protein QNK60_02805 [Flavobacteriales bacterium]|tara:strand:- start:797 stop:1018 length:222 start_codon:yes stop_codon:yes gene_type:complete